MVVGSIALEKVAVGAAVTATPVALFAGVLAVTVGAALTVELLVAARASATLSAASTLVLALVVLLVRAALGVIVAVLPAPLLEPTAAAAAPEGGVSVKLALVMVVGSIALEKVAVGATFTA